MLKIIKDNNDIFQASNGLISFKFYKKTKNQGKFEICKIIKDEHHCILKDGYSAINYFYTDTNTLLEYTSQKHSYDAKTNYINDSLGKGIMIIFSPLDKENNHLFFELSFTLYENHEFILIKMINIKDNSENPLSIHSISPLTIKNSNLHLSGKNIPTNLNDITWFKHGWQSWSQCELLLGTERDNEGSSVEVFKILYDNQDYNIKGRFYSEYCTVISELPSKNSLILGFVTLKDQFSRIILDYDNNDPTFLKFLTAFGCMDGIKFPESSIDSSEELFISFKSNNLGYYGLVDYAEVVKEKMMIKRISSVPVGWCSWYYYFANITQDEVIKNLHYFNENKDKIPIDFFQLDDGYFTEIGDFANRNEKFPNDFVWLFTQIKNAGYKSGIWTAPFFGVRKSELFRAHKDWFLRKSNTLLKTCYNWGAFEFGLDTSKKEVLDYLTQFYVDILWGFTENKAKVKSPIIDLLKIDFIYTAAPYEADYSDKTLTRAQIYYKGVKTIRDAITDKTFLLGCGAPIGPSVGLFDAMRIGYDTAPVWQGKFFEIFEAGRGLYQPCLKVALNNTIFRSFMHRKFWINDPDCLMIRRKNTELNLDEIRLQITVFGLSGGQILLSEDMTKLSEEEIRDFKLLLPTYNPKDSIAIPVDAFTSKMPSIYMLETEEVIGKRYLVSIINWNDEPTNKTLHIADIILMLPKEEELFYVYDFWHNKFLGEFTRDVPIELKNIKAHSCIYLCIIPTKEERRTIPLLISSDLHISQGCCEIAAFEFKEKTKEIQIHLRLSGVRKGYLYLKIPQNKDITKYNFPYTKIDEDHNIWKIYVEFKDEIAINITLS